MRSSWFRPVRHGTLVGAAALALLTGCSADRGGGAVASRSPSPSTSGLLSSQPALPPTGPPPPGALGVSPGGVTTKVDVPADSNQDEYGQACRAAKAWMDQHGGD